MYERISIDTTNVFACIWHAIALKSAVEWINQMTFQSCIHLIFYLFNISLFVVAFLGLYFLF